MAVRTSGVGTERKREFWDQYGVKKYDFGLGCSYYLRHAVGLQDSPSIRLIGADAAGADVEARIFHYLRYDPPLSELALLIEGQIVGSFQEYSGWGRLNISELRHLENARFEGPGLIYPDVANKYLSIKGGNTLYDSRIIVFGKSQTDAEFGPHPYEIWLQTANAAEDDFVTRLALAGHADVVEATWTGVIHNVSGQRIIGLGAPVDANDAARKADVMAGGGGVFGTPSDKTIATGAFTVDGHFHSVDTEDGAATDDLDTLTAGAGVGAGWVVVLKAKDSAHTVVCKHGTGNLKFDGQADFDLDHADDSIMLIYDGTSWLEISRSSNGV